jgi:hypothetical protein
MAIMWDIAKEVWTNRCNIGFSRALREPENVDRLCTDTQENDV